MEETINEALKGFLSAVERAANFAEVEIPIVLNELLLWEGVSSFLATLACLSVIFGYFYGLKNMRKWVPDDSDPKEANWDSPVAIVFVIFGGVLAVVALLITPITLDWLKILLAPRVFLIEYAAELVK